MIYFRSQKRFGKCAGGAIVMINDPDRTAYTLIAIHEDRRNKPALVKNIANTITKRPFKR